MTQPTVFINHDNLRHNLAVLGRLVAPARIMLAVKTNAYGHGLVEIAASALESGASALAVLEVTAGVTLREHGVTAPLFAWLLAGEEDFHLAATHDIELGISSRHELESAASHALSGRPVGVHLKIDTGLTRNGAPRELWPSLCARAVELESDGCIEVKGVWSHLADASPEDDNDSLRLFSRAVDEARAAGLRPHFLHVGASSAGLRFPESHLDYVRFGIAAYGISPFDDRTAGDLDLRPVMTLSAPVIDVDGHALILGAGFGHGILVGDHAERHVVINGMTYDVASISVDTMRIIPRLPDATNPQELVGATAIVFGDGGPSAEMLGNWCHTIGDEVVTSVSSRLPRIHTK